MRPVLFDRLDLEPADGGLVRRAGRKPRPSPPPPRPRYGPGRPRVAVLRAAIAAHGVQLDAEGAWFDEQGGRRSWAALSLAAAKIAVVLEPQSAKIIATIEGAGWRVLRVARDDVDDPTRLRRAALELASWLRAAPRAM